MSGMRRISHITFTFLPYSEAWLYDLVTAPLPYEAQVVAVSRENEDRFPFEPLILIREEGNRGSLTWFHGQLNRRLGWPRSPANPWKKPLRRLPRTHPRHRWAPDREWFPRNCHSHSGAQPSEGWE